MFLLLGIFYTCVHWVWTFSTLLALTPLPLAYQNPSPNSPSPFLEPGSLISFIHSFAHPIHSWQAVIDLRESTRANSCIALSILCGLHSQRALSKVVLPGGRECSETIDGRVYRWKVVVSTSVNFSKGPVTLMGPVIALSMSHNLESPSKRMPWGTV